MGIRIRWALFTFHATRVVSGFDHQVEPQLCCSRRDRMGKEHVCLFEMNEEEKARQWFGDMGLDCRQARRLLDATLRGVGPFACPNHPRRVKDCVPVEAPAGLPG